MPGLQVRVSPDVVGRLDEYLEALRPLASSRGDVVRILTALSTPEELRDLAMKTVMEQIDQIVTNAEITRRRDIPFIASADGYVDLPSGTVRVEVSPGRGRTAKEARGDLRLNLLKQYAGVSSNGETGPCLHTLPEALSPGHGSPRDGFSGRQCEGAMSHYGDHHFETDGVRVEWNDVSCLVKAGLGRSRVVEIPAP